MVVGDVGRVVAGLIDGDVVELLHCRILDEEFNQKEIQIQNAPLLHLSRSKVLPEMLDKMQWIIPKKQISIFTNCGIAPI